MKLVIQQLPSPLSHEFLFAQQMVMECDATFIRSMLLLIRGHILDAHAQTRRAIESCVWARRILKEKPELVKEWLTLGDESPPSKAWKEAMSAKHLFPNVHPNPSLRELRQRYQVTSRCLHPFRQSFQGRVELVEGDTGIEVRYHLFESEDIRQFMPTHFLWTLQTHDHIMSIFDQEVFPAELAVSDEIWPSARRALIENQTKAARHWIESNRRSEELRQSRSAAQGRPNAAGSLPTTSRA